MCDECIKDYADECVIKGIAWLDTHAPEDWRARIRLDILDINNTEDCVLGQVFAGKAHNPAYVRADGWGRYREFTSGYYYAVHTFFDGAFDDEATGPYGFSGWDAEGISGKDMTDAWRRELRA